MKKVNRKWMQFIELVIVSFANWLNPSAGLLLFLLKLCFQILAALQADEAEQKSK